MGVFFFQLVGNRFEKFPAEKSKMKLFVAFIDVREGIPKLEYCHCKVCQVSASGSFSAGCSLSVSWVFPTDWPIPHLLKLQATACLCLSHVIIMDASIWGCEPLTDTLQRASRLQSHYITHYNPILQMRKLKPRELRQLAQSTLLRLCQPPGQGLPGLLLSSMLDWTLSRVVYKSSCVN